MRGRFRIADAIGLQKAFDFSAVTFPFTWGRSCQGQVRARFAENTGVLLPARKRVPRYTRTNLPQCSLPRGSSSSYFARCRTTEKPRMGSLTPPQSSPGRATTALSFSERRRQRRGGRRRKNFVPSDGNHTRVMGLRRLASLENLTQEPKERSEKEIHHFFESLNPSFFFTRRCSMLERYFDQF